MTSWAEEEVKTAALGDQRLNKRLLKDMRSTLEDLASQKECKIHQASGRRGQANRSTRFILMHHHI
ncbi:MAG: transposase DNA-binding-containing protein [Methylococcales bacterium]|nr:transposase DNA-binding-containing protein [Methylococcales bacterium]